jgi:hypothetical protein
VLSISLTSDSVINLPVFLGHQPLMTAITPSSSATVNVADDDHAEAAAVMVAMGFGIDRSAD